MQRRYFTTANATALDKKDKKELALLLNKAIKDVLKNKRKIEFLALIQCEAWQTLETKITENKIANIDLGFLVNLKNAGVNLDDFLNYFSKKVKIKGAK